MKEQYSNQNISSSLPCQQKLGSPHRRFKPWRNWSINSPNPTTTPWNCSSTTWGGMSPSIHTTRGVTQNTRSHRTFWGPLNHLGGRIPSTLIVFLSKVMSKTFYTIHWPFSNSDVRSLCFLSVSVLIIWASLMSFDSFRKFVQTFHKLLWCEILRSIH